MSVQEDFEKVISVPPYIVFDEERKNYVLSEKAFKNEGNNEILFSVKHDFFVYKLSRQACAAQYEAELSELKARINNLACENAKLTSNKYPFAHLRIDASAAEIEGALKRKLIDLGWAPPAERNSLLAVIEKQREALEKINTTHADLSHLDNPTDFAVAEANKSAIWKIKLLSTQALALTPDSVRLKKD